MRLRSAIGEVICMARVALGAALVGRRSHELGEAAGEQLRRAGDMYEMCCRLRDGCRDGVFKSWRWDEREMSVLSRLASGVVGSGSKKKAALLCGTGRGVTGPGTQEFSSVQCLYYMCLAGGWELEETLHSVGEMGLGVNNDDGRVFWPGGGGGVTGQGGAGCWSAQFGSEEVERYVVCVKEGRVAAVEGWYDMRPRGHDARGRKVVATARNCAPFYSRFLPEYIRLPVVDGWVVFPTNGVGTVVEAEEAWHRRLGSVDGTTAAIIAGRLVIPRDGWPTRGSVRDNHKSWEENAPAKAALGLKIANYFARGVMQWVPPWAPSQPVAVTPLSAVDKNSDPWWRLVQDARCPNKGAVPWGVKYYTAVELSVLLGYGDFMFAEDCEDAYHLSLVPGCHCRRNREDNWVLVPAHTGLDGPENGGGRDDMICDGPFGSRVVPFRFKRVRQLSVGCGAQECIGGCDRAMEGARLDGHTVRITASHFGQTTAGSPLASMLNCIRRSLARRKGGLGPSPLPGLARGAILSVVWVDDTVMVTKAAAHGICGGLDAGCIECFLLKVEADAAQHFVRGLFADLHIKLTDGKRQVAAQRVTYTGVVLDTVKGRFFCPADKLATLVAVLGEMGASVSMSARKVAGVRGKVLHYSTSIPYVRVFAVWFSNIIATEGEPDWDRVVTLPDDNEEVCAYLGGVVERRHALGRPLWPPVASSLYGAFLAGRTGGIRLVVIVWDASLEGWGAAVYAEGRHQLLVGTFRATSDMEIQVRREAAGGLLAFRGAAQVVDMHGAIVLHRNDCVGALSALRKGSYASVALQRTAQHFSRLCEELVTENYFLHAPGSVLVEEGIDEASRKLSRQVAFPACTAELRAMVARLAEGQGWRITVDLFASESNAGGAAVLREVRGAGCGGGRRVCGDVLGGVGVPDLSRCAPRGRAGLPAGRPRLQLRSEG